MTPRPGPVSSFAYGSLLNWAGSSSKSRLLANWMLNLLLQFANEIKRYQDLKINLYSDMADGVISREEYKEFHAGYDRRIADRQRQLGKLKDERSQAMENSSGNIEWIEQFKKYRHLTELDRECIVHLIEKILIYDGKRIEVCFRYRDELENALQYIERFEDVLPAEEGVTIPERRNA